MPSLIENYVNVINTLPTGDVNELLASVYADDVVFTDPVHEIHGLATLSDYFAKLYKNTNDCQFTLHSNVSDDEKHALQWTMKLSHKRLRAGKTIEVHGSSFLLYNTNNKIISHRDYFDIGEMLYENIPVVGSIVGFIKGKLS